MDNMELKKLDINISDFNIIIPHLDINPADINMDIPPESLDFNLSDFNGFHDREISPIKIRIPDGDSDGVK